MLRRNRGLALPPFVDVLVLLFEQALEGVFGWPSDAPYDRILVSAMARSLPEPLVDQLADGGRMVCPVAGEMVLVRRTGPDRVLSTHGAYRFVPLHTPGA